MYPVTALFKAAVERSHTRVTQVDVLSGGFVVASNIPISTGTVSVDTGRNVRTACGLTVYADGFIPTLAEDPLYPASNELAIYTGIQTQTVLEMVPLGVFGFEDVEVGEDSQGLTLTLQGNDRGAKTSRSKLMDPVVIAKNTKPLDAINEVLATVTTLPGVVDKASTTLDPAWLMPLAVYQQGEDPWAIACNIAMAFGLQLYIDRTGNPVLDVIPDPDNSSPVATYDVDAGAAVTKLGRTAATGNTFNGVVAAGEGTDLVRPLQATAWDADQTSPFYYEGPYGKKPFFWSSPLILTLDQAKQAARAKLKKVMGGIETLTWDMVCDPSLDGYDVVAVSRDRAGVGDNYVIESMQIPLDATSPMTCSGRTSIVATETLE